MSETPCPSWRLCGEVQSGSSIFRRPLGVAELHFYWDTVFNGAGIRIGHMELEAEPAMEHELFAQDNIELAWMRMKQRFPLLAASVEELPGSEVVEFILDERSLCSVRPGEVNFVDDLASIENVTRLTDVLQNGEPVLSSEIIAKVLFGPQKDAPRVYHVFIVVAHYITDEITGAVLMRELCQELASLSKIIQTLGKPAAERLDSLVPLEAFNPNTKLSRARRRWRSAAAKIIHELRTSKRKGGHTLPISVSEPRVPAVSRTIVLRLSTSQTRRVVGTCHSLGITFGNALPVLSQFSHTRLLYRCRQSSNGHRRRPQFDNDEWEDHRVQHMYFIGPVDLRQRPDGAWYEGGRASDKGTVIGLYNFILPSLPSLETSQLESFATIMKKQESQSLARWLAGPRDIDCVLSEDSATDSVDPYESYRVIEATKSLSTSVLGNEGGDVAPSFHSLLTLDRFLCRARMVLVQNAAFLRHPLRHELQTMQQYEHFQLARANGLAWRTKLHGQHEAESSSSDASTTGSRYIISNVGASTGNRDFLLPLDYPLQSTSELDGKVPRRLHVHDSAVRLRCHPGELHLEAFTSQGQMNFIAHADVRVYDIDLVREWLKDVRAATVHYLGGESGNSPYIDNGKPYTSTDHAETPMTAKL